MERRSGQILILVLLVVVVALAVGLSVASRNITNLRTSTQTEQSQRAFSAAEGGVEDVLSHLLAVAPAVGGQTILSVPVGNLTANVLVASSGTYQQVVDEGNVAQIDLQTGTGSVQIEWAINSDTSESSNDKIASIEITQVNGSGGSYSSTRSAYAGVGGRANESGFLSSYNCPSTDFAHCVQITLNPNPLLLRIRPFWNKATIKVSPGPGGTLPAQTYNLTSTANTQLGITRKVQVSRSAKPQLPAVFDYVLFSEGDIVK